MYEKLLEEMKRRGITRNKLAKMSDITPSDLYSALNGERKFYDGWKKRVCDVLEMDIDELFEE